MREGRIPPDTLVVFAPVTGDEPTPASELEMYRSLRSEEVLAYHQRMRGGPPPIVTALLVGFQIRLWWFARLPEVRYELESRFMVSNPRILEDGEVWRLVSAGLLQTDVFHLMSNMLLLALTGWSLERALGRGNLLLLFFASVFGGTVMSMWFTPETQSLGSSGGVFGLGAAYIVFLLTRRDLLPGRGRSLTILALMLIGLLGLSFVNGLRSPSVDNFGHLGGMLVGFTLAFVLEPAALQQRPGRNQRIAGLVLGVMALLTVGHAWLGPRLAVLRDADEQRRIITQVRSRRPPPDLGQERYRDLTWRVPSGWSPGVALDGTSGFVSPAAGGELRAFSVRGDTNPQVTTVEALAASWIEELADKKPASEISEPEPAPLGGFEGLRVMARVLGDDVEEPTRFIEWRGAVRGVHTVEAVWQVDEGRDARLAQLRERLWDAVVWSEPEELRETGAEATTAETLSARSFAPLGEDALLRRFAREARSRLPQRIAACGVRHGPRARRPGGSRHRAAP